MRACRFSAASPCASGSAAAKASRRSSIGSSRKPMPRRSATTRASLRVSDALKRVGIEIASTRSGASASAASAATSAESMPPDMPISTRSKRFFST